MIFVFKANPFNQYCITKDSLVEAKRNKQKLRIVISGKGMLVDPQTWWNKAIKKEKVTLKSPKRTVMYVYYQF